MVVIASRQPGLRPETIRTRLARFMPTRAAAGWTVHWSARTEHAEEITDEHELQVAEHLGCYGSAVGHALAQAELTIQQLHLTADCQADAAGAQTITIEVRALLEGPPVDQAVFDAIVHRAEPSCPVLKGLASEVTVRLVAILEQPGSEPPAPPVDKATRPTSNGALRAEAGAGGSASGDAQPTGNSAARPSSKAPVEPAASAGKGHAARFSTPKWLTGRMAVLLMVAFGVCAAAPAMLSNAG